MKIASAIYYFALHVKGAGAFPPPLSAEREKECFRLLREKGDMSARDELIEHNLRLVVYIAKRFDNTDKDGNTLTLIDVIADKSDIADEIDTKIKVEKLRVILPVCLTERERLIIEMRYGLCGREELTQREIAKKLNISRSYVSRIEKSALEKLRKQF